MTAGPVLHPSISMKKMTSLPPLAMFGVLAGVLASTGTGQATTHPWTGAFNGNWNFFGGQNISNWGTVDRPADANDTLVFPQGGSNKAMNNDYPANSTFGAFHRLEFSGTGYSLDGNTLFLKSAGGVDPAILISHGAGTTALNSDLEVNTGTALTLSVNNAAAQLDLNGAVLASTSKDLLVRGDGTVRFTSTAGSGPAFRSISVGDGTDAARLILKNGASGPLTVSTGAALHALRTVSALTVSGSLSTGDPSDSGQLNGTLVTENLAFTSTAEFVNEFRGSGSVGDNINVIGTVSTGNARVRLERVAPSTTGQFIQMITNDGADPIIQNPRFRTTLGDGITEGKVITIGLNSYRFTYAGGTGNDFGVAVVPSVQLGTREWDAGGTTQNFSEATNWTSNTLPVATNTLIFGSLAPATPLAERFPIVDMGGNVYRLRFTAGGYALQQGAGTFTELELTAGIEATHDTGIVSIDEDLRLADSQTWALSGNGELRFGLNHEIQTGVAPEKVLTLENTGLGQMRFNGPIRGSGTLIKAGTGEVVMSGNSRNDYTGSTSVNAGTLTLARSFLNGAIPRDLTIGGGTSPATVAITADAQIADTSIVTLETNGALVLTAADTIGGLVLAGGTLGTVSTVLTVAGDITSTRDTTTAAFLEMSGSVRTWRVEDGKTLTQNGRVSVTPANTGITQRKTGGGTLNLNSTLPRTAFSVDEGLLQLLSGSAIPEMAVSLNGGSFIGRVPVLGITATTAGGALSPGNGTLNCSRLTLTPAVTVTMDISGTGSGIPFDSISVAATASDTSGAVSLGGASLRLSQSVARSLGSVLTIITNDGTDAINGTFAGLPQGAFVHSDTNRYAVSYTGGTGNDVTLTAVAGAEIALHSGQNGAPLANNATDVMPSVNAGSSAILTWNITNTGTATLNLIGTPLIQINGPDASSFSLLLAPAAVLNAGVGTSFRVTFSPTTAGVKNAQLVILSDDADESTFTLNIRATALPAPALTAFTVRPPSGGSPGTFSATVIRATPNSTVTLQASSDLQNWITIGTANTDASGTAVTGPKSDPLHTTKSKRFYRAATP